MSCPNCMNHKPGIGADSFTCPECGERWALAKVAPGAYWETVGTAEAERDRAEAIIKALAPDKDLDKVLASLNPARSVPATSALALMRLAFPDPDLDLDQAVAHLNQSQGTPTPGAAPGAPVEKLKALEAESAPRPWQISRVQIGGFAWGDADSRRSWHKERELLLFLRNLAPELIALWEAADKFDDHHTLTIWQALNALNAKAKEVLP